MFADRRAFTLIELLVVISIIGVLSSVVLSSLSSGRDKARDAKALIMIRQYQTALISFSLDNNYYPFNTELNTQFCLGESASDCMDDDMTLPYPASFNGNLVPSYMRSAPAIDTGTINVGGSNYKGGVYACNPRTNVPPKCLGIGLSWPVHSATCKLGTIQDTDGTNSVCHLSFPQLSG